MSAIKPIGQTHETVTLRRADFDALLRAVEDSADLAAVQAHRDYEERVGWEAARRNYLTGDEARRLLDGASPVRVWREKRGMKQRDLAEAAEVAVSYLAEIEAGKKPGSTAAIQRISGILEVPFKDLTGAYVENQGLRPVNRSEKAARRLADLAEGTGDRERLREEVRTILAEWEAFAKRASVKHQLGAAIQILRSAVTDIATEWARRLIELERKSETRAARRIRRASDALEAAIDLLTEEYKRR
jgi:transcriptional regulator with XRE-family HTH domain